MDIHPQLFTDITGSNSKLWYLENDFKKYINSQVNLWLGTRNIPAWKGYLITINPPDIFTDKSLKDINHLKKAIDNILQWDKFRWISHLYLTVEQRSCLRENQFRGIHFHVVCVLQKHKRISHVRSQIAKNLSSKKNSKIFCFEFLNKNNLNIRSLKEKKDIEQVKQYINGFKITESKNDKVKQDVRFRETYGIKHIYSTAT